MATVDDDTAATQPAWRQRAVSRSLNAARSRAEQRVQRFLDAAFALIDEKGTTDFTIQEVIDRSKQSLRGFYQYFDGKDELLLALFEETVRESVDDLHERRSKPNPSRSSGCAPSRSACTSGATRPRRRASAVRTTAVRSRSSRCSSRSRIPTGDRGDGAGLDDAARAARRSRRGRGDQGRPTPAAAASLIQQTVMYSWFGNRLVQNPRHARHRRGHLGVLPPRPSGLKPRRVRRGRDRACGWRCRAGPCSAARP